MVKRERAERAGTYVSPIYVKAQRFLFLVYLDLYLYTHTHFNLHCSMLRKRIVCVVPAGYGVPLRDGGRSACYCTKTEIIPIG